MAATSRKARKASDGDVSLVLATYNGKMRGLMKEIGLEAEEDKGLSLPNSSSWTYDSHKRHGFTVKSPIPEYVRKVQAEDEAGERNRRYHTGWLHYHNPSPSWWFMQRTRYWAKDTGVFCVELTASNASDTIRTALDEAGMRKSATFLFSGYLDHVRDVLNEKKNAIKVIEGLNREYLLKMETGVRDFGSFVATTTRHSGWSFTCGARSYALPRDKPDSDKLPDIMGEGLTKADVVRMHRMLFNNKKPHARTTRAVSISQSQRLSERHLDAPIPTLPDLESISARWRTVRGHLRNTLESEPWQKKDNLVLSKSASSIVTLRQNVRMDKAE